MFQRHFVTLMLYILPVPYGNLGILYLRKLVGC